MGLYVLIYIVAYLIGSLNAALLLSDFFGLEDPRKDGSGNPGATNVLRLSGKLPALYVLLGDAAKGAIAVCIGYLANLEPAAVGFVGLCALLGHMYPIFYRFKGGKGIATMLGVCLALSPWLGLGFITAWVAVALIYRYSSLAGILASILMPLMTIRIEANYFPGLFIGCLFVLWRHRTNIGALLAGTEEKINIKS